MHFLWCSKNWLVEKHCMNLYNIKECDPTRFAADSSFIMAKLTLCIYKVYTFGWWMGHYGSKSPKRHRGLSNNANAAQLDLGVYTRIMQIKQKKVETVRRYVSKKTGKAGYVGTKALKGTQPGPHLLQWWLLHQSTCSITPACLLAEYAWKMEEHGYIYIYINLVHGAPSQSLLQSEGISLGFCWKSSQIISTASLWRWREALHLDSSCSEWWGPGVWKSKLEWLAWGSFDASFALLTR